MTAVEYKCRPSEMIGDLDTYSAFCFDEACLFIISCLRGDGKKDSKKTKLYFDEDLKQVKRNATKTNDFMSGIYEVWKESNEE